MKKIICLACILYSAGAIAQTPLTDTASFEYPEQSIIVNDMPGNMWQAGIPQKTLFNASYDGAKAMVTDTADYYPVDNLSSFTFVMKDAFTEGCYTTFSFWHKYDMDSTGDYGIIEASYDGGITWLEAKDTTLYDFGYSNFWWDMDYHETTGKFTEHKLKITGTSDGWIKSMYHWQWWIAVKDNDTIIINPDSLLMRFTFISDSIDNQREGWMIDQIVAKRAYWIECTGIEELSTESNCQVYPNPVSSHATVRLLRNPDNATVTLTNTTGSIVYVMTDIHESEIPINCTNLSSGIYILRITDQDKLIASKKLIIRK